MRIETRSLSGTIDEVSLRLAEGGGLPEAQRDRIVAFLLDRQVASGRDRGTFAPFPGEFERGVRLFTGERLRSRVATRNVLTLEAARILSVVASDRADVRCALSRSAIAMGHACFAVSHCVIGECAHSSIAYMREAACDRNGDRRRWIDKHLRVIAGQRDGTGRWRRFPFYYTLLALLEVGTPAANAEIEYACPACERVSRRLAETSEIERRRLALVRCVLSSSG